MPLYARVNAGGWVTLPRRSRRAGGGGYALDSDGDPHMHLHTQIHT